MHCSGMSDLGWVIILGLVSFGRRNAESRFHIRDLGGQEITSILWNETKKCGFPMLFFFLM